MQVPNGKKSSAKNNYALFLDVYFNQSVMQEIGNMNLDSRVQLPLIVRKNVLSLQNSNIHKYIYYKE